MLIKQAKGTSIPDKWLEDFYVHNADGFGFMYINDNGKLIVKHMIGDIEKIKTAYYKEIAGKECAIHFRLATHGDVCVENIHPYEVINAKMGTSLWLMHNGVLHTGNLKNTKYSDTWHYINDYLKPLISKYPNIWKDPAFINLVEEHIDQNRFIMLDQLGNYQIYNRHQGIDYEFDKGKEKFWVSNTYAWSCPIVKKYYSPHILDLNHKRGTGVIEEDQSFTEKTADIIKDILLDYAPILSNWGNLNYDLINYIDKFGEESTWELIDSVIDNHTSLLDLYNHITNLIPVTDKNERLTDELYSNSRITQEGAAG